MISVEEAQEIVIANANLLNSTSVLTSSSNGFILFEDIVAPIDLPPFDNSAVDGYAFRFDDFRNSAEIKVIGEVSAGSEFKDVLHSGEAVRIFTGAMVPEGADTVVMQEKASAENKLLTISDEYLKQGANIRL